MRPLILVSPHTDLEGGEFPDASFSLSQRYSDAVLAAGGLPLVLPPTTDATLVREAVGRCDGVLLTGGDDVDPALYAPDLPAGIRATVHPCVGNRDLVEFILLEETLRQARPLFAICRGHQVLNVMLGGDLIADLPLQRPEAEPHNQQALRFETVHDVRVEPRTALAGVVRTGVFGVNSTHHQAVGRVAPPLRVAARSPLGIIEAIEPDPVLGNDLPFILSVQFHPERLWDRHPDHARLFQAFVAACRRASAPRAERHP